MSSEPRREPPPRAREFSSEPRRESPGPNRPPSNRPPQDGRGGERDHYVALKPDPANDAAPRRLRTEAPQPMPVEEYKPSTFARAPDKSVPLKRESSRRESEVKSSERVRPNAVISAHVPSTKDAPKAKSGGILGFIKRIFTGDPVPPKAQAPAARDDEADSREERRSGRDDGRNDDGGRHGHGHHRHRGGRGRHAQDQNRGERRGDRRPEQR
jgi:hypothetical protein